ncbi:hypothetical protein NMG60_11017996 [Bertholletia excelsa]
MFQLNPQKLEDDLKTLAAKMKVHEENIKLLKSQKKRLDGSILNRQATLAKHHSSSQPMNKDVDHSQVKSEEETIEKIMRQEKSAAGILCELKTRSSIPVSHLMLTDDVLGVVATLGKVDDENLSRLLSEYLGIETMLAIVCKSYDGVNALEKYEKDGSIVRNSGLQGLGNTVGRCLDGRYLVICLENLRPFVGEFVADDPQRRLDLPVPKLPSGESPSGFLGFAVNMINIDNANLVCLVSSGHGLRETLFYNLFSHLQVYRTREDMFHALPCVRNGALSLDGGMIKATGMFCLGNSEDVDMKFPKSGGTSNPSAYYSEKEKLLKQMKWNNDRMLEEIQREQALLDIAKSTFEIKKQEFLKYLAASPSFVTQRQN